MQGAQAKARRVRVSVCVCVCVCVCSDAVLQKFFVDRCRANLHVVLVLEQHDATLQVRTTCVCFTCFRLQHRHPLSQAFSPYEVAS